MQALDRANLDVNRKPVDRHDWPVRLQSNYQIPENSCDEEL
jgi:hypothetical protein